MEVIDFSKCLANCITGKCIHARVFQHDNLPGVEPRQQGWGREKIKIK